MNLHDLFKKTAEHFPDKPAVVQGHETVSYQALDGMISQIAQRLKSLGITRGQTIGLCFANSTACIALTYALWKLDAAVVPIDVELKPDEIRQVSRYLKLSAVISHKAGNAGWQHEECPVVGIPYYFKRINTAAGPATDIHIAFVRFTSGTTGERKGVVLSHERIFERIRSVNKTMQITPDDNVLWLLPMSHHFVSTIVLYLTEGATIVLADGIWSRSILETINQRHITLLYAAPFHYSLLAADTSNQGMPEVRLAVSTTIGLPADIHAHFSRRFGLSIAQAYGIIEIGLICINTEDPSGRPGSVGRILPDYKIRVENTPAYGEVDGVRCGELFFSGPGFFDAYFHPWTDGEKALQNGWFETGDIGGMDKEGFLYLYGRKNQVINRAGLKIFPEEIEAVFNRHPDVEESYVYGKAHDRLGQIIVAKVVLRKNSGRVDEKTLKAFCSEALAAYKVPEQICFADYLEKTVSTGKILRPR